MPVSPAAASHALRARFTPGTLVHVLPTQGNRMAAAARQAGLTVAFRPASFWPYASLIERLSRKANPFLIEAGWDEVARHNAVREDLVRGIRATPGGAAIIEVNLKSTVTPQRADADIVARAPKRPLASAQVFFEIKTGASAEIRLNQQYVYALTLIGGHVISTHPQLSLVGLTAALPLPPMDFIFVDVQPPDWKYQFAMVLASEVNQAASITQVTAYVAAAETPR